LRSAFVITNGKGDITKNKLDEWVKKATGLGVLKEQSWKQADSQKLVDYAK